MKTHNPGKCLYCADTRAPRRKAMFRAIQTMPNIPTARLARDFKVWRGTASLWRAEGEKRGCIPRRTIDGRAAEVQRLWMEPGTNYATRLTPVWPIGTTCTTDATRRMA